MIDPLMRKAAVQPLTDADVAAACKYLSLTRPALFDIISRRLVEGYSCGELDFSFCDAVINRLYFMLVTSDPIPEYTYSVFLAFDDGEYRHPGVPPESSAEDLYTRPAIAKILARQDNVT